MQKVARHFTAIALLLSLTLPYARAEEKKPPTVGCFHRVLAYGVVTLSIGLFLATRTIPRRIEKPGRAVPLKVEPAPETDPNMVALLTAVRQDETKLDEIHRAFVFLVTEKAMKVDDFERMCQRMRRLESMIILRREFYGSVLIQRNHPDASADQVSALELENIGLAHAASAKMMEARRVLLARTVKEARSRAAMTTDAEELTRLSDLADAMQAEVERVAESIKRELSASEAAFSKANVSPIKAE